MKKYKKLKTLQLGAAVLAALFLFAGQAEARDMEPLYLYAAPSKGGRPGRGGGNHEHSTAERYGGTSTGQTQANKPHDHAELKKDSEEIKKRSSGRRGYAGKSKDLKKYEPAMRPSPKKSYILSDKEISAQAEAFLLRPDGSPGKVHLVREKGQVKADFENPMGDGPAHGANNLYVVEKKVVDGTLVIRTAKWVYLHHSCGWGHDYRYDNQRNTPKSLVQIPLDITFDKLWSGNLHADVLSGDTLNMVALYYGKPAAGTKISVTTEQQWTKRLKTDEKGKAAFRLIEDYFSDDWGKFKRRHTGAFTVVARYSVDESGQFDGKDYNRVSMVTTFHWKYNPAKEGYMSYAVGLYAGIFTIGIGGLGIFYHRQRRKNPLKESYFNEKA